LPNDQTELDNPAEMVLPASVAAHVRKVVNFPAKPTYDGAQAARDALATAVMKLTEIGKAAAELQGRIAAASRATADVAAAEEALRCFLFENALAEKPDHDTQGRLARAVRDARQRAKPAGDDVSALGALNAEGAVINREITRLRRVVILAEAEHIADILRFHEIRALKAGSALAALGDVLINAGHNLADPEQRAAVIAAGVKIKALADYGPDTATAAANRSGIIRAASDYGRDVARWLGELMDDPHARLPDLEA
jgi:hypothetical protein